jgi:general secretion pathway protein I
LKKFRYEASSRPLLLPSGEGGKARGGFTLIEVLIALAILGIGLTVIIELFSGGLRLGRASAEYTRAVNYARMKMEEIAMKPNIEEGNEEGEFDPTYRWQVGVKKIDLLSLGKDQTITPPVEFFQVKVNVLWKSGSKERSAVFETYRTEKRKES